MVCRLSEHRRLPFFCRQQNILPSGEKRNWWWRKKASLWSKPSAFCLQFILVSLGFLSIYKCLHLDIIFYNYVMCYVPCHYLDTDEPWQWLSIFASLRLFLSTDLHQVQPKKYRKAVCVQGIVQQEQIAGEKDECIKRLAIWPSHNGSILLVTSYLLLRNGSSGKVECSLNFRTNTSQKHFYVAWESVCPFFWGPNTTYFKTGSLLRDKVCFCGEVHFQFASERSGWAT